MNNRNRVREYRDRDYYSILDNDTKEIKWIGKYKEFMEYINFLLDYDNKEKVTNRNGALDSFEKYYWGAEVWEWLEIIIDFI